MVFGENMQNKEYFLAFPLKKKKKARESMQVVHCSEPQGVYSLPLQSRQATTAWSQELIRVVYECTSLTVHLPLCICVKVISIYPKSNSEINK